MDYEVIETRPIQYRIIKYDGSTKSKDDIETFLKSYRYTVEIVYMSKEHGDPILSNVLRLYFDNLGTELYLYPETYIGIPTINLDKPHITLDAIKNFPHIIPEYIGLRPVTITEGNLHGPLSHYRRLD